MALLDAFCALKRRENTFKMTLWESIEQFAVHFYLHMELSIVFPVIHGQDIELFLE